MGFLDLIHSLTGNGLLTNPGDKFEARVTDSNRKVAKLSKDGGLTKYSVTEYGTGTRVETRTIRKK